MDRRTVLGPRTDSRSWAGNTHHGFEDLQLTAIWGVHDVNNHKSSRVMDKLGLAPVRTARHVHLKLLGDVYRDELVRRITADEWLTR